MDFWLLDEIAKAGWQFVIAGVPKAKIMAVLSVPGYESTTAVRGTQREAFQWLEDEIIQNHGDTPLGKCLRGGTSGPA